MPIAALHISIPVGIPQSVLGSVSWIVIEKALISVCQSHQAIHPNHPPPLLEISTSDLADPTAGFLRPLFSPHLPPCSQQTVPTP